MKEVHTGEGRASQSPKVVVVQTNPCLLTLCGTSTGGGGVVHSTSKLVPLTQFGPGVRVGVGMMNERTGKIGSGMTVGKVAKTVVSGVVIGSSLIRGSRCTGKAAALFFTTCGQ
jgi:hypothetical protein